MLFKFFNPANQKTHSKIVVTGRNFSLGFGKNKVG